MEIPYDLHKSVDETSNEWCVFIHGFGGSRRMFKKQVEDFKQKFNLIILDLPGNGESRCGIADEDNQLYNINTLNGVETVSLNDGIGMLRAVADGIIKLLQNLGIAKAHFVGVSIGTLVIAQIALLNPDIIDKIVMGGAIFGVALSTRVLMRVAAVFKGIVPYQLIVDIFAFALMPRKDSAKSRKFFIDESKKLGKREFLKWFALSDSNIDILKREVDKLKSVPSMVIMGDRDNVFMGSAKRALNKYKNVDFNIIEQCGHVCNIEKAKEFNRLALDYLTCGERKVA